MENISPEEDSILQDAMHNSGFSVVSINALHEALTKMEEYLMYHTGLNKQELSDNLVRLQNLVGEEESNELELEDIVKWLKAF
jgi:hypothetical protein